MGECHPASRRRAGRAALASRDGYIRTFVNEGKAILRLLLLFVARFGAIDYSARLLRSLGRAEKTCELLNDRAIEFLRLLAAGMSNREISESLFITVRTVKWHTNHIYRKLRFKGRA